MHGSSDVGHLVDRHPTVTPERLIAQLIPPPTFADVSFDTYKPDPAEPSQAAAVQSCRQFCDQAVAAAGREEEAVRQARGAARRRAVPRRRVRRRQDPPAGVVVLPAARGRPDPNGVRDVR